MIFKLQQSRPLFQVLPYYLGESKAGWCIQTEKKISSFLRKRNWSISNFELNPKRLSLSGKGSAIRVLYILYKYAYSLAYLTIAAW